jgi:hypothetical protein
MYFVVLDNMYATGIRDANNCIVFSSSLFYAKAFMKEDEAHTWADSEISAMAGGDIGNHQVIKTNGERRPKFMALGNKVWQKVKK